MSTHTVWPKHRYLGSGLFILFESWALGALLGAILWPALGGRLSGDKTEAELILTGVRYFGGLGLYVGAPITVIRIFKLLRKADQAAVWRSRFLGFHFVILEICALGALLGALVFPLAGSLGESLKTRDELVLIGARTGGFYFLVWAPGVALVRGFMRAGQARATRDRLEKHPLSQ